MKPSKKKFSPVTTFAFVIFLLSIIQIILILLGYFPKIEIVQVSETTSIFKMNYFNPVTFIGILQIIVVGVSGFYLISKKNFKLRNIFIPTIFLFISSLPMMFFIPSILPPMPAIFKVINCLILLVVNLVVFVLASLFGGILALIYKKFV